jgi:hypothetical protein
MESDPLRESGMTAQGYLEDAGEKQIEFIPIRYWLTVSYSGELRTFDVSRKTFYENVQSDGVFTRHLVPLIYSPGDPKTFKLFGTKDSPRPAYIAAFLLFLFGILSLIAAIRYRIRWF